MASIGQGSIGVTPKNEGGGMPGPPFDPTSANEGLSVDAITGKIVLGNDIGDPAFPGRIERFREVAIFTGGQLQFNVQQDADLIINFVHNFFGSGSFSVNGTDSIGNNQRTFLMDANGINLFTTTTTVPGSQANINLAGSGLQIVSNAGTNTCQLTMGDVFVFNVNGNPSLSVSNLNVQTVVPINTATANPAILPNGGSAEWFLGNRVNAATVFDNTRYIEVNISGTVYKLALVV